MNYIGIDLAWTDHNETGLCVIDQHGTIVEMMAMQWSDEEIVDFIKQWDGPLRIAIDAPLIVPNSKGTRTAEQALTQSKIHQHRVRAFHVSRTFLTQTFKRVRGEDLLTKIRSNLSEETSIQLNDDTHYVVETFPTAITASLFPQAYPFHYKEKKHVNFKMALQGLKRLHECLIQLEDNGLLQGYTVRMTIDWNNVSRRAKKHYEDQMDALLCAYALFRIHTNTETYPRVFGKWETGAIVIPYQDDI